MTEGRWVGSSSLYLTPSGDTWKKEAAAQGGKGGQRITYAGETAPPAEVATALQVSPSEPVVMRRRIILLDGAPVEVADSYWPLEVAGGTALTHRDRIRGGAVALLAELGWVPAEVTEIVTTRPATLEEEETLGLGSQEWVLVLTRSIANSEGRPYEVTVMVAPGTTRQLNYSMKVD